MTPPRPFRRLRLASRPVVMIAALAPGALVLVACKREQPPAERPPVALIGSWSAFPPVSVDLPVAVPLAPLLAGDEPDRLTMTEPRDEVSSLRPGHALLVRFNRPMVEAGRLDTPLTEPVLRFSPPVAGKQRWVKRNVLEFVAEKEAWSRAHSVTMTLDEGLRSLAGESAESEPHTIVFDTSPRLVRGPRAGRVPPGESFQVVFEGKVDTAAMASEMMMYEVEGGRRSIPFKLSERKRDEDGHVPVDVSPGLRLEPGGQMALALAPRLHGGGSSPSVIQVEITPRPHIEGIDCPASATEAGQCEFSGPPGRVVELDEALRLLATGPLADLPRDAVDVSPKVAGLRVTREGERLVVIRADWDPAQTYQVTLHDLRDREGHTLGRTAPLAVRSSGRPPAVRFDAGRWVLEKDAPTELRIDAIHVEQGEVRAASVAPGNELTAALSPASLLPPGEPARWTRTDLPSLVPDARPNRWGRGLFDWQKTDATRSSMVVVQVIPDREKVEAKPPTALMQQTDLGVSARLLPAGVAVWVTSIATARPVADAEITVGDSDGHEIKARTAPDGTAWVPWSQADSTQSLAVRAVAGGDRAVLLVDPRTAMGPRHLGLTPGEMSASDDGLSTSLFTERGIYRAGETVRAKAVLRVGAATERKPYQGPVQFRLLEAGGRVLPVATKATRSSVFGGAAAELKLDEHLEPGTYELEIGEEDPTVAPFATTTVQVRDYRPPSLRVDVSSEQTGAVEGETVNTLVSARYPFGSAAVGAALSWSWTRSPEASSPDGWSGWVFTGADVSARAGTVSQGRATIDEAGKATIATKVVMSAATRERAALEVSVRDASGRTTAARQTFVTYPAENEVGVREVPRWLAAGSPLDVEAIVVDHGGKAVAGKDVQCQIWREGWQAWWQRSRPHHDDDDDAGEEGGDYQARRAQEKKLSHRCKLSSADAPVHCAWTPDRPGSYLLEATTRDSQGHAAVASTRVYVAGPDEHPDRDAPGTAVTLTPSQASWKVGDTAQVAFESPFPDAEALFQVERGRVLHTERRRVGAGGQVFTFPVSADMLPGALASVSLVRPRTGPPGAKLDLDSPDLRVGMTPIGVTPSVGPLTVNVTLPGADALAGSKVPVALKVTDAEGRGVAAEVALYVVDEGTLRLTNYRTPRLDDSMFAHRNPWFAWEDLRRSLASRIVPPLLPGAGGDGGESAPGQRVADDRDRFDPTPLWLPSLKTDEQGEAKATLPLPRRPTDYRVMAVAIDRGVRTGVAQTSLVATRPLLLRPSLPRFVTEGDRFEATAFVHSTRAAATDATVRVTIGGEPTEPTALHFEAAGEQRVTRSVEARRVGDMVLRFEASGQGDTDQIEQTVHVLPRSRALHGEAVGSVEKKRDIDVSFPGAPAGESPGVTGEMTLTIASHPFVGFAMDIDAIAASPFDGPEPLASTLLGLAAYHSLQTGRRATDASDAELGARAARTIARLVALQTRDGGFGAHDRTSTADEYLTAHVLHAWMAARAAGWTVPERAREHAVEWLTQHVLRELTTLESDPWGRDTLALSLRALAEARSPSDDRVKALYDQRERLSPYGLAQLALAIEEGDLRRDELVAEATRRVLATSETEKADPRVLRWYDSSPRTYGAVLEAAARSSSPTAAGPSQKLAARLLELRAAAAERGDWSSHEVSSMLTGLAAYARRFVPMTPGPMTVRLDGQPIAPAEHDRDTVWYTLRTTTPGAPHRLSIESTDPAYFALSSRWTVPLGEVDRAARGTSAALHRVLETENGEPLADGAHVKLGSLVRVRLFVYSEASMPSSVLLRDRGAGGFEVIDAGADTTPLDSLQALLRMGPDDEVSEASGQYAQRSLSAIEQRGFSEHESLFFLGSRSGLRDDSGGRGLREFTYGVRAATVGTFLFPPASLEAEYAPSFAARSTMTTLTVDP